MPEMKRNFTKGKMNKDLDERLVPNGEYRDAMNIQVSTADDGDVGTVQNILGNIEGCAYDLNNPNPIPSTALTVGSVADEKNDSLYWLISGQDFDIENLAGWDWNQTQIMSDMIMRKTPEGCEPVFVDKFAFTTVNNQGKVETDVLLDIPQETLDAIELGWVVSGVKLNGSTTNEAIITQVGGYGTPTFFKYETVMNPLKGAGGSFLSYTGKLLINHGIASAGIPSSWSVGNQIHFEATAYHTVTSGCIGDVTHAGMVAGLAMPGGPPSKWSSWPDSIEVVEALGPPSDPCSSMGTVPITPVGHGTTGNLIFGPLNLITLNEKLDLDPPSGIGYQSLLFRGPRVLNFNRNNLITGINIFDDMLAWTDNETEPKKINITRSIQGTNPNGTNSTLLINKAQNYKVGDGWAGNDPTLSGGTVQRIKEEHITVIRKSPKKPLILSFDTGRDLNKTYAGITGVGVDPNDTTNNSAGVNYSSIISNNTIGGVYDFSALSVDPPSIFSFEIETDISGVEDFTLEWKVGDILLFKEFDEDDSMPAIPLVDWTIRAKIIDWSNTSFVSDATAASTQLTGYPNGQITPGTAHVQVEVLGINGSPPDPYIDPVTTLQNNRLDYVVDLEQEDKPIFELKFPRFSYRYKYEDGEYSTFAPWSEIAFVPGNFNYDPKTAWNTGMVNTVENIKLGNFVTKDIPKDVVSVDILYKEETSPNIYIVETVTPLDEVNSGESENVWSANEYQITSETIKATLPSNQLLRPWDNVPRKALGQEVSGNRLIYANYLQNYNLQDDQNNQPKYKPNFTNDLKIWGNAIDGAPQKSIKSLRDYKLGVVFTDKYGRETPILTSESGGFKVDKKDSINANRLKVGLRGAPPANMDYFKFYIKETSSEYYNLVMDRWYNAEDGNIWVAFPSSDRNKVDIDTTLYLKKGDGNYVDNLDKYKILAIEGEAPVFIKTKRIRIGSITHDTNKIMRGSVDTNDAVYAQVFGEEASPLASAPNVGTSTFTLGYVEGGFGSTSLNKLDEITDDLYINFESKNDISAQYKVSRLTVEKEEVDPDAINSNLKKIKYHISLETSLKEDINFIYDDSSNKSFIQDKIKIRFTQATVENSPKFDGRFFAKIANDGKIKVNITDSDVTMEYNEVLTQKVYVLDDDDTLKKRAKKCFVGTTTSVSGDVDFVWQDWSTWRHNDSDNKLAIQNDFQNPSGRNFNHFNARQCYFGLHKNKPQTSNHSGQQGKGFEFSEGVWFINRSTYKYSRSAHSNSLWWSVIGENNDQHPDTVARYDNAHAKFMSEFTQNHDWATSASTGIEHTATYQIASSTGIKNWAGAGESHMILSFGGIGYNKESDSWGLRQLMKPVEHTKHVNASLAMPTYFYTWHNKLYLHTDNNTISNFFGIGEDNPNYSDSHTKKLVQSISPGSVFKWADDPSGTVYTVSGKINKRHNVRFNRTDDGYGPAMDGTSGQDGQHEKKKSHREFLISNPSSYHKNWRFIVQPVMNWNPAGPLGEGIENGLNLGITERTINFADTVASTTTTLTLDPGYDTSLISIGMTVWNSTKIESKVTSIVSDNEITIDPPALNVTDTAEVGFTIRCVDIGNTATAGSGDYIYIFVDNKIAESDDHGSITGQSGYAEEKTAFPLRTGMQLYQYNVDSSATTCNNVIIKQIEADGDRFKLTLTGYQEPLNATYTPPVIATTLFGTKQFDTPIEVGERMLFRQVTMNSVSNYLEQNSDDTNGPSEFSSQTGPGWGSAGRHGIGAVGYDLVILEAVEEYEDGGVLPQDPFVWETEPKESTELDIYHEISENNPLELNVDTIDIAIPLFSIIENTGVRLGWETPSTKVINNRSVTGDIIITEDFAWTGSGVWTNPTTLQETHPLQVGDNIKIIRPNGVIFTVNISEILDEGCGALGNPDLCNQFRIDSGLHNGRYFLNWHNCYSFGNGVESNRIRDNFNLPYIAHGVKVSTTLTEEYKEERRKYGLIYSGIYNSTSGINNLNQFIAAENITKDINPTYGSIQKLYAGWGQQGNLLAICEDRVLSILANKDALYNADGDTNVVATNRVLGTATPYSGEYGISTNPESFASEAYRAYFTDKVRGTVMRLSMDGLTAISNYGMKDWFRDNLKLSSKLVGSYDDKKDEYNITLKGDNINKTVTFREDIKGWVSFKSFVPENAISCANEYYTFKDGTLWLHHYESTPATANTFYDNYTNSTIDIIFNKIPGSVKSFKTLNYEGSQARIKTPVDKFGSVILDNEYFNLPNLLTGSREEKGWYVSKIQTNCEIGKATDFIEKECKWFGHLVGDDVAVKVFPGFDGNDEGILLHPLNTSDFSIQGIGEASSLSDNLALTGCTNPTLINYDPNANIDDGSCLPFIYGCMDVTADNYDPLATIPTGYDPVVWNACGTKECTGGCAHGIDGNSDGTQLDIIIAWSLAFGGITCSDIPNLQILQTGCIWHGCTQPDSSDTNLLGYAIPHLNYNPLANIDDGSCEVAIAGCTDATAFNYNDFPSMNIGCNNDYLIYPIDQYPPHTNEEDQFRSHWCLTHGGCADGNVLPQDWCCVGVIEGCTNPLAQNFLDPTGDPWIDVNTDDGTCVIDGCTDPAADNYDPIATIDDGSCIYIGGCIDPLACNYDAGQSIDDGSCLYCGDNAAINYDEALCNNECIYPGNVTGLNVLSTTTSSSAPCNGTVELQWIEPTPVPDYYTITVDNSITTWTVTNSNSAGWGTGTVVFSISSICVGSGNFSIIPSYYPTGTGVVVSGSSTSVSYTVTVTLISGCTENGNTHWLNGLETAYLTLSGLAACNYNSLANDDDGSCIASSTCTGCSNASFIEYCNDCWDNTNYQVVASGGDPWTYSDAGLCTTPISIGCTNDTMFNGNSSLYNTPCTDSASFVNGTTFNTTTGTYDCCEPVLAGCMDTASGVLNSNCLNGNTPSSGTDCGNYVNTADSSCLYDCPQMSLSWDNITKTITIEIDTTGTAYSTNMVGIMGYSNTTYGLNNDLPFDLVLSAYNAVTHSALFTIPIPSQSPVGSISPYGEIVTISQLYDGGNEAGVIVEISNASDYLEYLVTTTSSGTIPLPAPSTMITLEVGLWDSASGFSDCDDIGNWSTNTPITIPLDEFSFISGCNNPAASNYNPLAVYDTHDPSACVWTGCTDDVVNPNIWAGSPVAHLTSNYEIDQSNIGSFPGTPTAWIGACNDGTGDNSCCDYMQTHITSTSGGYHNIWMKPNSIGYPNTFLKDISTPDGADNLPGIFNTFGQSSNYHYIDNDGDGTFFQHPTNVNATGTLNPIDPTIMFAAGYSPGPNDQSTHSTSVPGVTTSWGNPHASVNIFSRDHETDQLQWRYLSEQIYHTLTITEFKIGTGSNVFTSPQSSSVSQTDAENSLCLDDMVTPIDYHGKIGSSGTSPMSGGFGDAGLNYLEYAATGLYTGQTLHLTNSQIGILNWTNYVDNGTLTVSITVEFTPSTTAYAPAQWPTITKTYNEVYTVGCKYDTGGQPVPSSSLSFLHDPFANLIQAPTWDTLHDPTTCIISKPGCSDPNAAGTAGVGTTPYDATVTTDCPPADGSNPWGTLIAALGGTGVDYSCCAY